MSKYAYNRDAVEKDDRFYTVVVTFNNADPAVYDAGCSMAEAVHVQAAVCEELRESKVGHDWQTSIAAVDRRRLARREMSAVRHGWDDDIETLEDFADRPHKGELYDGTPFDHRLSSEDFKADELARQQLHSSTGGAA
jgi:hypothetical protein